MSITRAFCTGVVLFVCGVLLMPASAAAQEPQPADQATPSATSEDQAAPPPPPAPPQPASVSGVSDQTPEPPQRTTVPATSRSPWWSTLQPELTWPTSTWIAVVLILVLTLQARPLTSWHTLDGLVLVLIVLLLPLRGNLNVVELGPTVQSVQGWAFLLLCLAGVYWLIRGSRLLFAKTAPAMQTNVSVAALLVLIVAGLFVAGGRVARAPLSDGSRDGLIGGIYTAETGKLPYGDAIGHDARSPLLYLLHAGAAKLVEPSYGSDVAMRWADRSTWLDQTVCDSWDLKTVRLVNGLLLLLLLVALAGIGHRLHSVATGQTLVVILCFFPAALECLSRPEIMLPTVLVAWSIAFALLPGVGGLLSVLTMVFAGLAWPWAWLALPALLAYFFRHQWQALGATVGLLGGVAAIVVGLATLVAPALPRADGVLREAAIAPSYAARLSDDGTLVIDHHRPSEAIARTFKRRIWLPLLERDDLRLDSASTQPALPNGVDAGAIRYRDVTATGPARSVLQDHYRTDMSQRPQTTQTWAALRTLLEATWKPEVQPATPAVGVWDAWAASRPQLDWTLIRRIAKILVGLLALVVAFSLVRGQPGQLHQLLGGLLVICVATLLVSMAGVASNWVWLMPAALATLAAKCGPQAPPPQTLASSRLPLDLGPAPRITVDQ